MRIIAGKNKGRNLISPEGAGVRPTSSKVRAAIFNVLENLNAIKEAKTLDLCCGTGALGLEALSRGAAKAIFIDGSAQHLKLAWNNALICKEQDKTTIIRADATNLPPAKEFVDLVFLDPPYFKDIPNKALSSLIDKNWLAKGALVMVETSKQEDLSFKPEDYITITIKFYGNSKFTLLERV
jgi:16S rRNA (guanine966-N2)-methyltransferase